MNWKILKAHTKCYVYIFQFKFLNSFIDISKYLAKIPNPFSFSETTGNEYRGSSFLHSLSTIPWSLGLKRGSCNPFLSYTFHIYSLVYPSVRNSAWCEDSECVSACHSAQQFLLALFWASKGLNGLWNPAEHFNSCQFLSPIGL